MGKSQKATRWYCSIKVPTLDGQRVFYFTFHDVTGVNIISRLPENNVGWSFKWDVPGSVGTVPYFFACSMPEEGIVYTTSILASIIDKKRSPRKEDEYLRMLLLQQGDRCTSKWVDTYNDGCGTPCGPLWVDLIAKLLLQQSK